MKDIDALLDWLHAMRAEAPNLRLGQLIVLLHAARQQGLRMSELAELCEDSLSTTSRNVRNLTSPDYAGSLGDACGLLELQRGGDDGRARHIVLSERGAELVARLSRTRPKGDDGFQPGMVTH